MRIKHFFTCRNYYNRPQRQKYQIIQRLREGERNEKKGTPIGATSQVIILQYLNMSRKSSEGRELDSSPQPISTLPQTIRLTNLNNQWQPNQIISLRLRIDELEEKVGELEAKLKAKRKRIRRKSSEVEKKHKCEFCKKLYGSLVSLNLHLRIKHKKDMLEKERAAGTEGRGGDQPPSKPV